MARSSPQASASRARVRRQRVACRRAAAGHAAGTSDRHEQILAAFQAARLETLRAAVRHHDTLERSFLLRARLRPDEAVVWELAAEEQRVRAGMTR